MAAIWKGSITFGLVNIPVELRSAVRSDHISFRLLHEDDLSPVKYERVCEKEGDPIPWNEIVKGYEYEKGKFVIITQEDFEKAALETSHTIDILDFVKENEIDPRYFETPYYLIPTSGGEKAYALLRESIRDTGSTGIGKIIIRQKQHLAAIKVVGQAIVLELMRFSNELVDMSEYKFPSSREIRPQEQKIAKQLIDNLTTTFDPEQYSDEYRANLMRIINAKRKGKTAKLKEPEGPDVDAKVIDLMDRLRESLGQQKRRKPRTSSTTKRKQATTTSTRRSAKRKSA